MSPTLDDAYAIGARGGPTDEDERLAFEAWMRGHCWALSAEWNGSCYIGPGDTDIGIDYNAMRTRMLWAAWRDRAALASH